MLSAIEKLWDNREIKDSNFDLQRIANIWRFVAVATLFWLGFGIYFWFQSCFDSAVICGLGSIVCYSLLLCRTQLRKYRIGVGQFFLLSCLMGVTSLSLSHGGAHRETIYFLSLGVFIATHLFGIRIANYWAVAIAVAILSRFLVCDAPTPADIETLVNSLGVTAATLFFCHQAEALFCRRTERLKQLSHDLEKQSETNFFLATTDSLTGLANRYGLQNASEKLLNEAIESGNELAMLLIDLDKFKEINDSLGHAVGDRLLQKFAVRLSKSLGHDVAVARLGGDEFCILVPDIGDKENGESFTNKLHAELCQPISIGNDDLTIGASIGISFCPSQSTRYAELLTFADTAMYQSKSAKLPCLSYDSSMTDELRSYRELKDKLSMALERGEFFLLYQPQICFKTGNCIGAEALIRWEHDGETIGPWRFIPVLESSGLMPPIGRWVVEEACRQLSVWQKSGPPPSVSINVSATQFSDPGLVGYIRDALNTHQISSELLDFEITESLLVENVHEAKETLEAIKALGCSISIDDFGTGYSSLAYLKQFPIDRLKIDREFVKDFPAADDGLVASSVVALGQALNMRVLAEGIETKEQYQFLRDTGCEEFQGFIRSKPVLPEICQDFFITNPESQTSPAPTNPDPQLAELNLNSLAE